MKKNCLVIAFFLPFFAVSQTDRNILLVEPTWHQVLNNLPIIIKCFDKADSLGLNKIEYDYEFISKLHKAHISPEDTAEAKERILKAAVRWVDNLLNGEMPDLPFNGLKNYYKCHDVSRATVLSIMGDLFNHENHSRWSANLIRLYGQLHDSVNTRPNPTLNKKLRGIREALKTVRWIDCLLTQNEFTIVVNIPSASLLLYHYDKPLLESKVIVGTRKTRTPVFTSMLTDVTIFPYWMVPKSIATKELLPEIRKDLTYLERNNFQVIDSKGRVTDPYNIDWDKIGRDYFPYTIRQSTGCDNSLGLIKLNVNGPFNVYLHDTPWKVLFESQNRFFSHGCIRVQKAKELSAYLLMENRVAVDTLDESKGYTGKTPKILPIRYQVPVLVLYNIAWFNAEGAVRFYPDIYSKF